MNGDTTITISILVACIGGGIGVASFINNLIKNKSGETGKQASTNARIETKIDSISENVSTIKSDMQNLNRTVIEHGERIAVLENVTGVNK